MAMLYNESTISRNELLRLADKLPNLKEVSLRLDSSVTQSNVADFVRSCQLLQKLHILFPNDVFSGNFDDGINELFDVNVEWDASERVGSITIEHK